MLTTVKENGVHSLQYDFRDINSCPWYWGDIHWKIAEQLLLLCEDGNYLVRDSRDDCHMFTVSYKHEGRVYHTRLKRFGSLLNTGRQMNEGPSSITKILEQAIQFAQGEGGYNMLMHRPGEEALASQISMKMPLGRHEILPSLQYLTRLKLRCSFSIPKLKAWMDASNVSPNLRNYVLAAKFVVPNVEDAVNTLQRRKAQLIPIEKLDSQGNPSKPVTEPKNYL